MARKAKIKDKNQDFLNNKEEILLYDTWQSLLSKNSKIVKHPQDLDAELKEKELFKVFLKARDAVYLKHRWLIRKAIEKNSGCAFDIASDSEQQATLYFYKYVHNYNPYRDRTFSSYMSRVLLGGVREAFYQSVYCVRRSSYLSLIKNKLDKLINNGATFEEASVILKLSLEMQRLVKITKFHRNEYASYESHLNKQVNIAFEDNYNEIWIKSLKDNKLMIIEQINKLNIDESIKYDLLNWVEDDFVGITKKRLDDIIKQIG